MEEEDEMIKQMLKEKKTPIGGLTMLSAYASKDLEQNKSL
jgi:hypothetical protein